ncbi:T6SS immunity protein Tli4 family protein [Enterobacter oligotrophicus]|uniref:T6SS immunity protein Tli4 family protein n=2 Tax=Enterobacter oligotrophicus TaxID=2478464 RepID=UPI0023F4774E|nr:T6SS immunity protein Tli4 family protein [Enterobacter oligotrophicus]
MSDVNEFDRKHRDIFKDYHNAFVDYDYRGYTVYINSGRRLYHFWRENKKHTGEKSQTAETQIQKSEPDVFSLLNNFRPRNLYEVPAEQGFCLPYGFIARDSGHEPRNMGVTYRLKNHPDVSIFFQDFGPNPGPGERRPDPNMSAKDYVTYFWNTRYGHSFREVKLYGEGFTYPEIDKRNAVAAFAKFTRFSKEIDYGYVAFVKGTTPDEPDLLFYVMRDSRQAADNSPMDKDELKKMAEHIVSTIKRR